MGIMSDTSGVQLGIMFEVGPDSIMGMMADSTNGPDSNTNR